MAQLKPLEGGDYYLWKYLPSRPAAGVFIALFTAITIALCWRMSRSKSWFCIPFAIGGFFEMIGYITRIYAYNHTDKIPPYAVQNTGILLAPVFFAASVYMVLGRTIRAVRGERFSVVRVTWLTKVFVSGDVVSLLVQAGGAGMMATEGNQDLGQNMVLGGLFIQLVIFGFFVISTIIFHVRMQKHGTWESVNGADIPWRKMLHMLYACSALIIVRSVFRVIEYIMGADGYLLSHEWTMYVFDSILMLAVMVIFVVLFPHRLQAKPLETVNLTERLPTTNRDGKP